MVSGSGIAPLFPVWEGVMGMGVPPPPLLLLAREGEAGVAGVCGGMMAEAGARAAEGERGRM